MGERCSECKEISKNPELDCCEIMCDCQCHWDEEKIKQNVLASYDHQRQTEWHEAGWK